MALKKEILIAAVGAPATIHRVDSVTINKLGNTTVANISSFYSTSALSQGLQPLAQISMPLEGLPAKGQDAWEFAEAALAAAAPDGETVEAVIGQQGVDRYIFASAEILDL
ncbi:hypothetical protein B0G62_12268 [Paraburkholderia eburnea]|uniref:Uncharacterized protein n=1 Tax=Paraburkholderia eburnea TaxID=1189126 RepID=A0A2S4LWB9_9BURK|nr:hypothetical protein [Paraburkholderia eburnea]POR46752.1 hypothetical protein B0G62_12268 [Paraburkholderia eburnea]PRZ17941.1 hypothetical protein BX588_12268 [Paraburkholderia eburnea]